MADFQVLKTDRDCRADRAIEMLEGVIDRIRAEGVCHISFFYVPVGGDVTYSDFFSEDIPLLVGGLEIQKAKALAFAGDD